MTTAHANSLTTTHVVPGAAAAPLSSRVRLAGLAGIGSGSGIVVGHLLTVDPGLPQAEYLTALANHHTWGIVGGLATAVGAFLLLPALAGILGMVRARGASLATAAAVLAGVGITALGAGDVMQTFVMGGLVRTHPDTAAAVFAAASNDAPLLSLPFALAPLLVLGLVLLGVALLRARAVPVWASALLIVGAVLITFSSGGGPRAALTLLPLGAALASIGGYVVRSAR